MKPFYIQRANITRVKLIDVSAQDFTDENGFFVRSADGGALKYCPVGNEDAEAITKTIEGSAIFDDPEVCRKVFSSGTTATNVYVGYAI